MFQLGCRRNSNWANIGTGLTVNSTSYSNIYTAGTFKCFQYRYRVNDNAGNEYWYDLPSNASMVDTKRLPQVALSAIWTAHMSTPVQPTSPRS